MWCVSRLFVSFVLCIFYLKSARLCVRLYLVRVCVCECRILLYVCRNSHTGKIMLSPTTRLPTAAVSTCTTGGTIASHIMRLTLFVALINGLHAQILSEKIPLGKFNQTNNVHIFLQAENTKNSIPSIIYSYCSSNIPEI